MDIAVRAVLQSKGLRFKGTQLVNINDGGDTFPNEGNAAAKTWFDIFNPSRLLIKARIVPSILLEGLPFLTDPCSADWARRPSAKNPLTAESLYQFTRVAWVDSSVLS